MTKKRIKIRFVGKDWDRLPPGVIPYPFTEALQDRYEIVYSDEPDYVISKESRNFYASCLLKYPQAKVRILFAGEAFVPDFNIFDYAIGFDRLDFGDRYFRLNTFNFFKFDKTYGDLLKGHNWVDDVVQSERKFCNFVYSNGQSNSMRVKLFEALVHYRKVDAAGALLRNTDSRIETGENWMQAKVDFQRAYKFSTAIENSRYDGYTTEKLLHPMAAGSIPIYWGNPSVSKEFNTKSFVNCHEYDSIEDVVERVRQIDQDEETYRQILTEPWLDEAHVRANLDNAESYHSFLHSIFDSDLADARRRGDGTWAWRYEDVLRQRIHLQERQLKSPKHRIIRRLQKWGFKQVK